MAIPIFSVTIDDTSPTITYLPFSDSSVQQNLSAGWISYYTTSGFVALPTANEGSLGDIGVGTSLHVTSSDGASLKIIWNGKCHMLFG